MTIAQLSVPPLFKAFDNNGNPLAGGLLYSYAAGTSTPQATYPSSSEITPNPNPVTLNFKGEAAVWLDPTLSYKLNLTDASGNTMPGYPVDNIQGLLSGTVGSLIPSTSNVYTLGNSSFSWQNIYVGNPPGAIYNATANLVGYYGTTAAEIALGITPTNFQFPGGYPWVDPQRYGGDPTNTVDSTTAVQTALNVANHIGGTMLLAGLYKTGALSITFTTAFAIVGMGHSTGLACNGTPSAHLTIYGGASGVSTAWYGWMRDFSLSGPGGSTTDGILLDSMGAVNLENIYTASYNRGLYCFSAIDVRVRSCAFNSGVNGVYCRNHGVAGSGCNLIILDACTISSNTTWGVDYDAIASSTLGATGLQILGCDMENNGSSASTGAVHIGPNCAVGLGGSLIAIDQLYSENNSVTLKVDAQNSGNLYLHVTNLQSFSESSSAGNVTAYNTKLSNIWSPSAAWTVAGQQAVIEASNFHSITDTTTYPYWLNVIGSNLTPAYASYGRPDTFTATLTGVSGGPITATVNVLQQGKEIELIFPQIMGTSNTTAATLTGLPAAYQPTISLQQVPVILINSGADTAGQILIASGSGTMTLSIFVNFTNSGSKGIQATSVRYRLTL
jgi:hypothetical protein